MKIVEPSALLREAAEALRPIRDDVVVVGAMAVDVALQGKEAAVAQTRDVDLVVGAEDVNDVVGHLERADLRPSTIEHEKGFTWVRDDLKVQLIQGFHPFPKGAARGLPANPAMATAGKLPHREKIAFVESPKQAELWVATPACVVALKQHAFGRSRHDGKVVQRDYYDAFLLLEYASEEVLDTYNAADAAVKERVRLAVATLAVEGDEIQLAGREMVELGAAENQRDAEAEILLGARAFGERL